MKNTFVSLTFLLMMGSAIGQIDANSGKDMNHYLKKSKNLKTAGWIIMAGGLTVAAIGGIIQFHDLQVWYDSNDFDFAPDFRGLYTAISGGCVAVLSVPFFIGSGAARRKAASLSLNQQKVLLIQKSGMQQLWIPSVSLAIKL